MYPTETTFTTFPQHLGIFCDPIGMVSIFRETLKGTHVNHVVSELLGGRGKWLKWSKRIVLRVLLCMKSK